MVYQNATAQPREELQDFIEEGVTDFTQFKGLEIAPPMPMTLVSGHVPKISIAKGDLLRATQRTRAPGTNFSRWQSTIDAHSVTLIQLSEEEQIPDEQQMLYEDYFDIEARGATEATNRLKRSHEIEVAGVVENTGNFAATPAAVAYILANLATMKVVNDILQAIRTVKARGEVANTIIIPGPVYDVIRQSADLISFIAGAVNPGAQVTDDNLQKAFARNGITSVLVPDAYVNQSEPLKDDVINPIWPVTYMAILTCRPGALRMGGWGRTFFWDKEGPLFQLYSYRDEVKASNIIRARKTTLVDVANSRAGQLITTSAV